MAEESGEFSVRDAGCEETETGGEAAVRADRKMRRKAEYRRGNARGIRRRGGFTLAETLVTVLILLMVSGVVAAGIPAARRAYEKVVISANAEVLLSTSVTALRDQLATAGDVTVEGKTVTYYSNDSGVIRRLSPEGESGAILLREYLGYGTEAVASERQLVTDAAATGDLYVTYEGAELAGRLLKIRGLSVYRKSDAGSGAAPLTAVETLNIRLLGETG